MDARERWQALQARLTAAKAAVDAGNRERALDEINAALELDRDFLAAQALRDRIASMSREDARTTEAQPSPLPEQFPFGCRADLQVRRDGRPEALHDTGVKNAPAAPAAEAPTPIETTPVDGSAPILAKFEQRAKRRRVDRRIDAARAAIAQQRLKAAAAVLDEIIDLDPNLPELADLTAQFDVLRRASATPHRGPWVVAAAVFAVGLLGGTWLEDSTPILSRQIVSAAPLALPLPEPLMPIRAVTELLRPADAAGAIEHDADPAPVEPAPRAPDAGTALTALTAVAPPRPAMRMDGPAFSTPATEASEPVPSAPPAVPVAPPIAVPSTVEPPDDQLLIKQALQRYRKAYDGLDAQSAQAVWPAVNQAALARAFDDLESQSLRFDACDVRLRGEVATATCHGSARYVPKVGSRDPRVEPRVWNFTLHKADGDWTIDTARAER